MDGQLQTALTEQLRQSQRFTPCLGVNVAIIDEHHGTWTGAAGWRKDGGEAPMPDGARFYIYSVTKTFVAARLLQVGIDIDQPYSAYLADPALPDTVTVRRLLNHTAGVPSYTDLPDYRPATRRSPGRPWSRDSVLERCCRGKLDFAPGQGWHYSNTGYMLLALLLEKLSGRSLAATLTEGLLHPLALDDTYVAEEVDQGGILTPSYSRDLTEDGRMADVRAIYHPGWCLTGLIASTALDTARFLDALMAGKVLPAAQLAAMTTSISIGMDAGPFFRKPSCGLGLMTDPDWGFGGMFGHGGDGPGANAWAMHLPDFHGRALTMVILCNTSMGGHPFPLVKDLLRTLAANG